MDNLKISDAVLEKLILSLSRLDISFFLKVKEYLKTDSASSKSYFNDTRNQLVFNLLAKYHDKIGKLPEKETMQSLLTRSLKDVDADSKVYYDSILDFIYSKTEDDIDKDFIYPETVNFIKENKAYEALMLAREDLLTKNYSNILNRFEDALSVNFDKDLGVSIKDVEKCMSNVKTLDEAEVIPTGYASLDNLLGGGMHPKELICFAGVPGSGKCSHQDVKITVEYEIDDETGEII